MVIKNRSVHPSKLTENLEDNLDQVSSSIDASGTKVASTITDVGDAISDLAAALLGGGFVDKYYTHSQIAPSATWNITHNLGKRPAVMVADTSDRVVEGFITYIDDNSLIITFTSAFAGQAYLN